MRLLKEHTGLCINLFIHLSFRQGGDWTFCCVVWAKKPLYKIKYITIPIQFDWVQIRALAGPLKDIQIHIPKPLLCCIGHVLRVVVLLEGEPSLQSEVLSRFSSRISPYFALFNFHLILTSLPVPAAEKHPHSMILPPPCFPVGMVPVSWLSSEDPNRVDQVCNE